MVKRVADRPTRSKGRSTPVGSGWDATSTDSFIRSFNPNLARRTLRLALVEIAHELDITEPIPHSFDETSLVNFARRLLRSMPPLSQPHLLLAERLGITSSICASREEAHDIFDSVLEVADDSRVRARFQYLIGHFVHLQSSDHSNAKRDLRKALRGLENQHDLKARTYLTLGRAARRSDEFLLAEDVLDKAANAKAIALRPIAHQYIGLLRHQQGQLDAAIVSNRRAIAMLAPDDWRARSMFQIDYAMFQMEQRAYRKVTAILEEVLVEQRMWLDIRGAGNSWNNLAVAQQRLGDYRTSLHSYVEALQLQHSVGDLVNVAKIYRNLTSVLIELDELGAALASTSRSIDAAETLGSASSILRARSQRLELFIRAGVEPHWIGDEVDRCQSLIDQEWKAIGSDVLQNFSKLVTNLYRKGDAPAKSRGGKRLDPAEYQRHSRELEEILGGRMTSSFAEKLQERLQAMETNWGDPKTSSLQAFLLLYVGDFFRSRDYALEFSLPLPRARQQIRELCAAGVIEAVGAKKGKKYGLAFHRDPQG